MTPREFKNNARTHVFNKGYAAVEHAFGPTACVDAYVDQEQEERDFHVATDTELDNAEARELGSVDATREYILTDRDVWHKNPYYTGKPGPHPEDDHYWDELEAKEAFLSEDRDYREDCETCQRHGGCTCGNLDDMPF
jgi:hypothetical protein